MIVNKMLWKRVQRGRTRNEEGHAVDQIYLYYQKAVGKVFHQKLLLKLRRGGISGNVLFICRLFKAVKHKLTMSGNFGSPFAL